MRWLETEWRETPDEGDDEIAWARLPRTRADEMKADIGDLELGKTYDFRVRYTDDEYGEPGDWVEYHGETLTVETAYETPPPTPTAPRLTTDGCLTWDIPTEHVALAGYEVRHAPGIVENPNMAEPAHTGLAGAPPYRMCVIPGGQRTLYVYAVDEFGNKSATPARVVVTARRFDDQLANTVRSEDQHDTWPGLKQGGSLVDTDSDGLAEYFNGHTSPDLPFWRHTLEPFWCADTTAPFWLSDGAPFWTPILGLAAGFWTPDPTDTMWGVVSRRWIEYIWDFTVASDEAGVGSRLSVALGIGQSRNAPWRIEYRRPGSGSLFWGASVYKSSWATPTTASFWATMNEPWSSYPGRLDSVQAGTYRFRLLIPGGRIHSWIDTLTTTLTVGVREEITALVTVPLGGTRVPPDGADRFRNIDHVELTRRSGTAAGVVLKVEDTNGVKGPWITAEDEAGTDSTAVIDVRIRGY